MDVILKSDIESEDGCLLFNLCTPYDLENSTRTSENSEPSFPKFKELPYQIPSKNVMRVVHLTDVHMDHKYATVSSNLANYLRKR